jgi:hypothetical protein
MIKIRGTSIAALLLVTGGLTATLDAPASAAPGPDCDTSGQDTDWSVQNTNVDLSSDVVVGVPHASVGGLANAGVVDIHHPNESPPPPVPQRFGEAFLGQTPHAGDGFGTAVAYTDVDSTGQLGSGVCEDLAIGAPGAAGGRGRVTVARGGNAGIQATPAVTLTGRNAGDHFGATLAIAGRDVWVGAPDQNVGGRAGAGAVYHYRITGNGSLTFVQAVSENTAGVPGTAEVDDHFGAVLSARFSDGRLAVGEPDEDAGRVRDAGAVTLIATGPQGEITRASKISQNTPGVPGSAQAGDRLGASVSQGAMLAVGVPGQTVRGRRSAGLVQVFRTGGSGSVQLTPTTTLTQESPTIPGASEVGDQFGAAVLGGNGQSLWIGVPGEGLGGEAGTGEVLRTQFAYGSSGRVTAFGTVIRLGGPGADNIPGAPQAGAHVGSSLSVETPDFEGEGSQGGEGVVVAVPGYSSAGAGSGEVWVSSSLVSPIRGNTGGVGAAGLYTDSAGPAAHEHYGTLASIVSNGPVIGDDSP